MGRTDAELHLTEERLRTCFSLGRQCSASSNVQRRPWLRPSIQVFTKRDLAELGVDRFLIVLLDLDTGAGSARRPCARIRECEAGQRVAITRSPRRYTVRSPSRRMPSFDPSVTSSCSDFGVSSPPARPRGALVNKSRQRASCSRLRSCPSPGIARAQEQLEAASRRSSQRHSTDHGRAAQEEIGPARRPGRSSKSVAQARTTRRFSACSRDGSGVVGRLGYSSEDPVREDEGRQAVTDGAIAPSVLGQPTR